MSSFARSVSVCSVAALWALPAQAEPRKPTHVACVGDSITEGAGATSTAKNYVEVLQGLLGDSVQVRNFGNSGSTMLSEGFGDKPYTKQAEYTGATDFVSKAGAGAVVSVVIILGANDSKPYNWDPAAGKNDQQYLRDYRALVDHFAGLPTKPVVYLGYPLATGKDPCCEIRGKVIHDEQMPLIEQLAMEKHLPIIDLNTGTTGHPEYFDDGVHPNDAGYAVMAGLVKAGLGREPKISVTGPKMGDVLAGGGMIPLVADASADYVDIINVEFFHGTTSLGKATTKPFTLEVPATPGSYMLTAKVTDATLATATSPAVTYQVAAGNPGGANGGGAAGGGVAGNGGAANGGTAGSGTAVVPGGSASAGSPGGTTNPSTPTTTEAGCGCSTPGSHGAGSAWSLVALAFGWAGLRRRRVA